MTDATRANIEAHAPSADAGRVALSPEDATKVRAIAEAMSRLYYSGVPRCSVLAVRFALRGITETQTWPWRQAGPGSPHILPSKATITNLTRAHLPGVVGDDLVFDVAAGAAIYAAMERGS